MSTVTYRLTSPRDVYEEDISVPYGTNYPITVTCKEHDEDTDPTNNPEFDFTGSSIALYILSHHSDDNANALVTIASQDWTITENAAGTAAGKQNQIKHTLVWDTLIANLELLVPYWYRIVVTDAGGDPYQLQRGEFSLDDK